MLQLKPDHHYPVPDWKLVYAEAERRQLTGAELDRYWTEHGQKWVQLILSVFGTSYQFYESEHFWLICGDAPKTAQRLLSFAEKAHTRLFAAFQHLVRQSPGKIPIIATRDVDTYYNYIAEYYSDGEHAGSSGVFLDRGYGHFALQYRDISDAELITAHELTHALLSNERIPLWLNEGLAQMAEAGITGRIHMPDRELRKTIGSFWTAETIQEFWRGESFQRLDDGRDHSYHLALVLTNLLSGDANLFRNFVSDATREDGGEASMQKHFECGLGDLADEYLGPGDWALRLEDSSSAEASN